MCASNEIFNNSTTRVPLVADDTIIDQIWRRQTNDVTKLYDALIDFLVTAVDGGFYQQRDSWSDLNTTCVYSCGDDEAKIRNNVKVRLCIFSLHNVGYVSLQSCNTMYLYLTVTVLLGGSARSEKTYSHPNPNPYFFCLGVKGLSQVRTSAHDKRAQ